MHNEVVDDGQDSGAGEALRLSILNALSQSLASKLRDAVSGRASSGIEDEWEADGEFYQGYDDANRHEFVNTRSKPSASGGQSEPTKPVSGSTVFPNITQPYCDAAAARVGDMLLPTDDRNFAIKPTPIPDMFEGLDLPEDEPPAPPPQATPGPEGQSQPPAPQQQIEMPNGQIMGLADAKAMFDKVLREADRKAEKAQTNIDDWLIECQYHGELRKVIDDCSQIGSGVIKGPVPIKRKTRKWSRGEDGVHRLEILEEIKPASMRVDPWNLFPDPACGESIHNGAHIFERDSLTGKRLEDLIGLPGYIESQIRACLIEGPKTHREADRRQLTTEESRKHQYDIWYFNGTITADELRAAGCDCGDDPAEKSFPAMVTMVNDRVIRASLNPLDSGEFPYDVIPWKRRPGMPWGMGVARQMRTPQRIVVAATRNLMDNAGMAAGPQIVVRRGYNPVNGIWEVKPLKMWEGGADADDASGAPVSAIVIPMILPELTAIITLGMDLAERVTGLPMLLQGQQGATPNTATGTQIMNNNGNSLLRRVARLFDSCVTEPHVRRYYAWLMEYGEDDDAKGDYQIEARGSTALVERDIQSQEMLGIVQLSLNPAFELNPAKTAKEFLKSRRFDPSAFEYTEEEKKARAEQQPPPAPQVQVAEIREKGAMERENMKVGVQREKLQAEQANSDRAASLEEFRLELERMTIEIDRDLADATLSQEARSKLDHEKTALSMTAMKLATQKELSIRTQALAPPSEPAGRAAPGRSYEA